MMDRIAEVRALRAEIVKDVPEADLGLVGLHANMLGNTRGGRPTDNLRDAVRAYERLGAHAFALAHRRAHDDALRACPCSACQSDAAKLSADLDQLERSQRGWDLY